MISDYDIRSVLRNSLFRGMERDFFRKYYNSKQIYIAKEGEIIYKSGDKPDYLYLIVQGEVSIKFSSTKQIINRYLYDFFGEDEILKSDKRISSAVAMNDTIIYKLSYELLHELCLTNIRINRNLKNIYDSGEEKNKENDIENYIEPLSVTDQNEVIDITLELEDETKESFTKLSEEELDLLLEKQRSQQAFKKVMKKVGKVDENEELKDFSDLDDWQFQTN